jgi:hypothetical protein
MILATQLSSIGTRIHVTASLGIAGCHALPPLKPGLDGVSHEYSGYPRSHSENGLNLAETHQVRPHAPWP